MFQNNIGLFHKPLTRGSTKYFLFLTNVKHFVKQKFLGCLYQQKKNNLKITFFLTIFSKVVGF